MEAKEIVRAIAREAYNKKMSAGGFKLRVGLAKGTILRILNLQNDPKISHLIKMAEVVGLEIKVEKKQ